MYPKSSKNDEWRKVRHFWGNFEILRKNRNFGQNSKFLSKKRNFGQKSKFWSKIEILVKYANFGQISKFWSIIGQIAPPTEVKFQHQSRSTNGKFHCTKCDFTTNFKKKSEKNDWLLPENYSGKFTSDNTLADLI